MRLILHIGMHKTASTTIQTEGQQANTRGVSVRYAVRSAKTLLKAVRKQNFKPWRKLIRQAHVTPIVSHEAFSHVLCRPRSSKKQPLHR